MNRAADYAKLVLSMQPVAYYRMEPPGDPKDRAVLFDSTSGAHHGTLQFSDNYVGEPYAPGRFGQSLRLRGPMVGDYAIVPDCPKAMKDRLTVSVWAYLMNRPIGRALIATHRGVHAISDDAAQLQFTLSIDVDAESRECLEAAVTPHDGQKIAIAAEENEFPIGAWQHIAMVADGTVLHLYRNGEEVASAPCAGVLPGPEPSRLAIGCVVSNDGATPLARSPYFWPGRLDELAIFNRALSPDEIRTLYLGTPARQLPGSRDSRTGKR